MSTYSLENQRVLIVGGSSGMGLATAQHAHRLGAHVTIVSRSIDRLELARKEIGARCDVIQADAKDEASMVRMFEKAGKLDHIFFCAGTHPKALVRDAQVSEMRTGLEERFWGAFFVAKYGAPQLRRDGSITCVTGVGVFKPGLSGESVVAAGAGAVDTFVRAMAVELRPIRVNSLSPGAVDSPLTRSLCGDKFDQMAEAWAARIPAGRVGTPDDVAHAAIFLMTNRYVTGSTLHVEGGYMLV